MQKSKVSHCAAVVVIASKMKKADLALEEIQEEKQRQFSGEERVALVKLQEAGLYRCCRGAALGKKLEAARILKVGKPIMEKLAKPKKLSQISEIVDLMLGYTQVELGITAMDEWDEYDSWVEKQLTRIPLFTDILDPTFLIIRGPLLGCPCACRNTCISQQSSCWWKSAGRWPFRKSNSPRASQRCRSSCPRHVPVCRSSRCRNCTRSSHWLGI